MTTRILPAVADADAARSVTTLLSQLPDAEPAVPVGDSTQLLDTLARLAAESLDELPEVVLVHERIGPVPALELIREVALRFPAVGVVLISSDAGPAVFSAAMDSGARGLVALPLSYEELAVRVQAAAQWSAGVRRHLGASLDVFTGPGGTVTTVTGAKGGVGTTLAAVQLALAARASGRTVVLVDMDLQAGDVASYLDVQFRRSIADLAAITDISPRVLADAVFNHESGLALLLAPGEGERGEEVTDRAARQIIGALRTRYEAVVVDCGTQMNAANAAAVEMADVALLVTTPDVVSGAGRQAHRADVGPAPDPQGRGDHHAWSTGTPGTPRSSPRSSRRSPAPGSPRPPIPAHFKELQSAVDAGRLHDLDGKSTVKQALWALAGELGLLKAPGGQSRRRGPARGVRAWSLQAQGRLMRIDGDAAGRRMRRAAEARGSDAGPRGRAGPGQTVIEFVGVVPLILLLLVALWQCALVGYTFVLAGNAADEGARAGAAAERRRGRRRAGRRPCTELPSSSTGHRVPGEDGDRHVPRHRHPQDPRPDPGRPQRLPRRRHRRPCEGALSRAHPHAPRARRPGPSRPGIHRVRRHPAARRPRRDPARGRRVRREPGGHGGAGGGAGGESRTSRTPAGRAWTRGRRARPRSADGSPGVAPAGRGGDAVTYTVTVTIPSVIPGIGDFGTATRTSTMPKLQHPPH